MNYKVWAEQHQDENLYANYKTFDVFKKQFNFTISTEAQTIDRYIINGPCQTTNCKNHYNKQFRAVLKAPFCAQCMGHRPKELFVDRFPDIAKRIIRCDNDLNTLTCGAKSEVILSCDKSCSRCSKQHEYNTTILSINRNGTTTCDFCCGRERCTCQKTDEFCCYECRMIKPLTERCAGHSNICKQCKRTMFEKNTNTFMRRLYRVAMDLMKRKERKQGDLTSDYLEYLFNQEQKGRCYISNVPLVCKSHSDWKASIERLDNGKGYSNDNVKLIICELQSNSIRQWTREKWDEICSITLGALQNIPDESELLKQQTEIAKKTCTITPRMTSPKKTEINDQGQIKCKKCNEWLEKHKFVPKHNGYCRECLSIYNKIRCNTLRSILLKSLSGSKMHAKERNDIYELTFEDLIEKYVEQGGRCYYSYVPLAFTGFYQLSIERINTKKGYTKDNIVLVIHPLNVGDWSRNKKEDDNRVGSSGWNRDKFIWAIKQNDRIIEPILTYIKDVYDNSTPIAKSSVEQKVELLLEFFEKNSKFPNTQYIDPKGVRLGKFINSIRSNSRYKLDNELKQRILDRDPQFFK
jgi:hypothetical protein